MARVVSKRLILDVEAGMEVMKAVLRSTATRTGLEKRKEVVMGDVEREGKRERIRVDPNKLKS